MCRAFVSNAFIRSKVFLSPILQCVCSETLHMHDNVDASV